MLIKFRFSTKEQFTTKTKKYFNNSEKLNNIKSTGPPSTITQHIYNKNHCNGIFHLSINSNPFKVQKKKIVKMYKKIEKIVQNIELVGR